MKKIYLLLSIFVSLALLGSKVVAAPIFTIQNVKDACGGQANGSFDVVITAAAPDAANHLRVQIFGPPDFLFDLGVPSSYPVTVNVTGLTGLAGGKIYVVVVRDVSNTVAIQNIFDYPDISITSTSKTDNSANDCSSAPNGTVDAVVTGGSPAGVTYTWNGPGGPYVSVVTPLVTGLAGGTYTLTVTDNATACSDTSGPVVIGDPIPVVKTVVPTGAVNLCPSDNFTITVQNSELDPDNVVYEVLINGGLSSPLVSGVGTGADLPLTILSGNFANGNVITVRAHFSSCTTYQLMTGAATLNVQILSSSAVLTSNSRCQIPFNGAIDLSVTGAIGSLSYAWTGPGGYSAATEDITALEDGNYSVLITDGTTGCNITSNFVVANARPTIDATSVVTDNTRCIAAFNGAINITPSGGTGPYTFAWTGTGVVAGSEDQAALDAGAYSVIITETVSGCTVTKNFTVNSAVPTIDATFVVTDNTRCVAAFNGAINITPTGGTGPYTFAWTGTGVIPANEDQTGLNTGAYSVIITETISGCTVTKNFNVNNAAPIIDATSVVTDNTRCVAAFNGAIDITPTGGAGPYTFLWTGTGVVPANEDQVGLNAGAYSVVITETLSGCTVTKNFNLNSITPTIDATSVITDNSRCIAAFDGAIDITPSGGTGPYSFAWTGAGVVAGSEDQVGLTSGAYSVVITETPSGCTVTKNFTVNDITPVITAPGVVSDNITCSSPFTGAIDITPAGGAGVYSFAWTGAGVVAGNEDQTGLNAGAYSVTVTEIASGCFVVSNFTVNNSLPVITATLSGTATICPGASTDISVSITGGTGPFTVVIDNGVGTIANYNSDDPISVSPLATTTYNLVSVTDATGCTAGLLGSAVITIATVATPTLTGLTTPCSGTTTTYNTDLGGSISNYLWTVSAGGSIVGGGDGFDFADIDWSVVGPQTITVQYDDGACTTAITTLNVDVKTISISQVVTDNTQCAVFNGAIDITVSGLVGPGVTYLWDDPSASTTEDISGLDAGTYTVTINDPGTGCSFTSAAITVGDNTPTLTTNPETVVDNSICPITPVQTIPFNGSIDLKPLVDGLVPGAGVLSFAWSSPDYPLFSSTNEDPSGLQDGTYDVIITHLVSGCTLTPFTITVGNLQPVIDPNPSVSNNTKCSGPPNGAITLAPTGGGPSYTFAWTDGGTFTSTSQNISALPASSYDVVVTDVTTGCTGSSLGNIISDSPPTVGGDISGTAAICLGQSSTLTFNLIGGGATFDVTYTDGTSNFNLIGINVGHTISVTPLIDTDYSLVSVTDVVNGCTATAPDPNINQGGPASITISAQPADAINPVDNSFCTGSATTAISVDDPGPGFTVNWFANPTGGVSLGTGASFTPAAAGTFYAEVSDNVTGCISAARTAATLTQIALPTAAISGTTTICVGQSATLSVALTGTGPWNIVYTDGITNFPINAIASSPHSFNVNPILSTSYSLVSVSDALCGNGTVNGSASVTVNAISGNPATPGNDTWIGYVYDDQASPAPPVANIDYNISKYRGFINETDIPVLGFSSYNTATDAFDLNLSNIIPVQGSNVCGSYLNDYSIRFRMTKTFTAGVYTFSIGGDDGVQFFVDGVPVTLNPANSFTTHTYSVFTSDVQCIAAGAHDLVIEYFERGATSRVSFDYQPAPAPAVSTPVTTCINSAIPTLTASSADPGVTGYNWYTDAALTNLVASTQNYTPLAADLDMATAATSDFYVVATYACGQTQAAQLDVTVLNSATITTPTPPVQICQSGGIVDLSALVSAVPAGGTFTFSGTGITTSPNFDPALVTGTTTITVDYTSGTCTSNTTFDIDVISTATITVPGAPIDVCQASGLQDLTLLVSATPLGGTFTFTGAGVTGSTFDPNGQSGAVSITVDYNAGGCTDSKTINYNVVNNAVLTVDNTKTVCPGGGSVDLTTLVSAVPAGGTFTFSGATGITGSMFDPTTHAGSAVPINISYIQAGCTALGTVTVTVRAINDPICGTVGTGTCATVVITPQPSPATCTNSDGSIVFNIVPFVPVVNNTGVRIDIVGVSLTNSAVNLTNFNDPNFVNLPAGVYDYTIEYGDPSCIKTGQVTIDQSGTVGTPVTSNLVNPVCFGQAVGSLTLDVPGETGNLLEWSLDGIVWNLFTAGNQITGIPAGNILISVRRNSSDPCNAAVAVSLTDVNPAITATLTPSNATCNNNDGSITVTGIAGGTGVANFTYELNGQPFAALPTGNTFTALGAGSYLFTIVDNVGCRKDFTPVTISFPGFVNTTTPVASAPDCTGSGANGSIQFQITDVGTFQVGYTTDPLAMPINFTPAGGAIVTIPNLVNGSYTIWIQSAGAQCATKLAPVNVSGVYAVSFIASASNGVCFGDNGGISVASISGSPGVDYSYELVSGGNTTTGTITAAQALGTHTISSLMPGSYQIRLIQNQSACTTPVTSAYQSLTLTGPTAVLDTLYVNKTISYPDLATGSVLIGIQESLQEPYEVRMELITPFFPSQSFVQDWTPASRNAQNLKMELGITHLFAGGYQLSLRDALGCVKVYAISLDVDSNLTIPNIFTPNGDGVNDIFYIRNLPADAQLIITNRWGKEVFTSNSYQNDWNGGDIADGIYYYKLALPDQSLTGWIEIMRGQ